MKQCSEMRRNRSPEMEAPVSLGNVVQDFYYSFWFSQGNPGLQYSLFLYVSAQYGHEKCVQILADSEALEQKLKSLRFPSNHLNVTAESSVHTAEFSKMAGHFINALHTPDMRSGSPMSSLAFPIMDRDIFYQDRKKAREYKASDPHQSHFRDYAILQKPTGSDTYDTLFTRMRRELYNSQFNDVAMNKLHELATAWETAHPGQQFLPTNRYA